MATTPYDPSNSTSTPAGYMTPEQVEQMYGYGGRLTKGATRDETITSPWQGLRMMADALSMNKVKNQAGQQQMGGINDYTHRLEPAPNTPPQGATAPPPPLPSVPSTPTPTQTAPIPAPPIRPPAPITGAPVMGLQGSVPSAMPGGMPGAPIDPMMSALMTPPPGMGMA
jgi:hypothetical protein